MPKLIGIIEIVLVFFTGASIFSFINVIICRFPLKENFIQKRSYCTKCGHTLSPLDLIPVFSWILLKGKCRYCHTKLSLRHPLLETAGGIMAFLCFYRFQQGWQPLIPYAFLAVLTLIAFVDIDTMKIPNAFVLTTGVISLLSIPFFPELGIAERILGIFITSVPLFLIDLVVPGGFGGGDIKLTAICGLYLGWQRNLWALAFAILAAGCYCICMLAAGKLTRKSRFPFGPFLCLGAAAAALFL